MTNSRRITLGFSLLCLLEGTRWISAEILPGMLSGLLQSCLGQGVVALLLAVFACRQSRIPSLRFALEIAFGGVALLALPQILLTTSAGRVSELSATLIFLLTPIFVVFLLAQQSSSFGNLDSPLSRLAPALAGLAGAALVIPFTVPPTSIGIAWLAAMAISALLAGFAAVRLHGVLAQVDLLAAAAIFCGASAMTLATALAITGQRLPVLTLSGAAGDLLRLLLIEAPVLLLTVWLLRQMRPAAFSSRYFLTALITIFSGYLLLHPVTGWTTWLGMLLLAGGSAGLLRGDSNEML